MHSTDTTRLDLADSAAPEARVRLAGLLEMLEDRLLAMILEYARERGYTRHTSTLVEDWRVSIRRTTTILSEALREARPLELSPGDDYASDPVAAFGIEQARRHRGRGVGMGMFLGLFKYYRQIYRQVARETASDQNEAALFERLLDRLFDRMEIGLCLEWADEDFDERVRTLREVNLALTNEKNKFLTLYESTSTPIFLVDTDGVLVTCNLAAARLLRHTGRPGERYFEIVHEEVLYGNADPSWCSGMPLADAAPWLAGDVSGFLLSEAASRRSEVECMVAGALRTYQVTLSRMQDVSEKFSGAVVEVADVTLLRAQEREVREGRGTLQRILDAIGAGILVVDPETLQIISGNRKAADIVGQNREELIGDSLESLQCLDPRGGGISMRDLIEKGAVQKDLRLTRPDGSVLPVSLSLLTGPMQGELKIIVVLFDISRQKDMERQLMQSQKLESIGQLAAGIAHEINTPIQYVGGNVEFFETAFAVYDRVVGALIASLERECSQHEAAAEAVRRARSELALYREETPEALEQTREGVERVATIVQAIRRFSHPGGEGRRPLDLNKTLRNTVEVARNEWKHVAEIAFDLDAELPLVWCSPGDINQVLLNIVVNAAHAIAEKVKKEGGQGRITVRTRREGDEAVVAINDTGKGIAPEHKDKIFDPFFTTKAPGMGTGQGLAIAHAIVERHRGTIGFESTPGQGTTFVVRLPLGEPEPVGDKEIP